MIMSIYSILLLLVIITLALSLMKTSIVILPALIKIVIILCLIGFVYSIIPK